MNVSCPSCETIYRIDPNRVIGGQVRARCKVCSDVFGIATDTPAATVATEERATSPQIRAEPVWRPEATPQPVAPHPQAAPAPVAPVQPVAARTVRETPPRTVASRLSRPITPSWSLPKPEAGQPPAPPASTPEPAPEPEPVVEPPAQPSTPEAPPRPSAPVFQPTLGTAMPAPPLPEPVQATPAPAVDEPPAVPEPIAPPKPEMVSPPESEPPTPQVTHEPEPFKTRPINPFLTLDPKAKARRLARALVSDIMVYQPEKREQALEQGNLKEAFEEEIKKSWAEFIEQVGEELADSTSFFNDALNEILAGGEKIF